MADPGAHWALITELTARGWTDAGGSTRYARRMAPAPDALGAVTIPLDPGRPDYDMQMRVARAEAARLSAAG